MREAVVKITILILTLTVNSVTFGQSKEDVLFQRARSAFQAKDYHNSISISKNILEKNYQYTNAHLLLADIYSVLDSLDAELHHLKIAKDQTPNKVIILRLGKTYFKLGQYQLAKDNLERYLTINSKTKLKTSISKLIKNAEFGLEAIKNPIEFSPVLLDSSINTKADEYWPQLSIDNQKIYFTRLIRSKNYRPQEDLYYANYDSLAWQKALPLSINTDENEGTQTISADQNLLFFTACNRTDGFGSCDIYYSIKKNNEWSQPQNAGKRLNTNQWEAQPSISSDGKYLYFSSSRKGGKGKKDIYRIEIIKIKADGTIIWGQTENLGDRINTEGNEISPFIHPNNEDFYFASDEHIGLGGFDLFHSKIINDSIFSHPKNLGYPLNSYKDEQGLFITSDGLQAYYASDRDEIGGLDIYYFKLDSIIKPKPVTYANIKVIDAISKEPIQAQIKLINLKDSSFIRIEQTKNDGTLLLSFPVGNSYGFSVNKKKYLFYSQTFDLTDNNTVHNPYQLVIELQPIQLDAEITLRNIYFPTDSYTLLPESKDELERLFHLLKENSTMKIHIIGYTDNVGSTTYNQNLSEKRAQSVLKYLMNKGIESNRLQSKGLGESNPIDTNETEEGRQKNRRTTIKIVSI